MDPKSGSFDEYKLLIIKTLEDHSAKFDDLNKKMDVMMDRLNASLVRMSVIETEIKTRTWITATLISVVGSGLFSTIWGLILHKT